MRLLRFSVKGIKQIDSSISLDFYATARIQKNKNSGIYRITDNLYLNTACAISGINATGKTSILKIANFVVKLLSGKLSLAKTQLPNYFMNQKDIELTVFFLTEEKDIMIHKLESVISIKEDKSNDGEFKTNHDYYFKSESIVSKKISSVKNKKDLLDFEKTAEKDISRLTRITSKILLLDDMSLISAFLQENNYSPLASLDSLKSTDFNYISSVFFNLFRIPQSLLNFLDPSIESLIIGDPNKKTPTRLKFKYDNEEILLASPLELCEILSSGTVKGILDFMFAIASLKSTGIYIVDEIENHYNKAIVKCLINLFIKNKTNPNGSCLLFTTHYPELLDLLDRNDQVYFSKKSNNKIVLEKVEDKIKRNDLRKSEIYKSNYLCGTAPSYEAYETFENECILQFKEHVNG